MKTDLVQAAGKTYFMRLLSKVSAIIYLFIFQDEFYGCEPFNWDPCSYGKCSL